MVGLMGLFLPVALPASANDVSEVKVALGLPSEPPNLGANGTLYAEAIDSVDGESARIETPVTLGEIATLGLAPHHTWRLRLEMQGFWAEPLSIRPVAEREAVSLEIHPTTWVEGEFKPPEGEALPEDFELRFAFSPPAPPQRGWDQEAKEHIQRCPISDKGIFRCKVPTGELDLRLRARGFISHYFWEVSLAPDEVHDFETLRLARGASVSGWVESSEPGAVDRSTTVELQPFDPHESFSLDPGASKKLQSEALATRVDRRGFFHIEGVPEGSYTVLAHREGFATAKREGIRVIENAELHLPRPLQLERPLAVEIWVEPPLDPHGQPWQVRLTRRGPDDERFSGTASREGLLAVEGVPAGGYRYAVIDQERESWLKGEIEIDRETERVWLEVPVVLVDGRVTRDDEPFEGPLWFRSRYAERTFRFDADDRGLFAGYLPNEGLWKIQVLLDSRAERQEIVPVYVERAPGASRAVVEIEIPDLTLAGEVVDEDGQPVAEARVEATLFVVEPDREAEKEPRLTPLFYTTETDEDGAFELNGLSEGTINLAARHREKTSDQVLEKLAEGSIAPHRRLILRERLRVAGEVVDPEGQGVPNAQLLITPEPEPLRVIRPISRVTAADGSFEAKVPAGGSWLHLLVMAPTYAMRGFRVPTPNEGEPLFVPLEREGGTLVLEMPGYSKGGANTLSLARDGVRIPPAMLSRWLQIHGIYEWQPERMEVPHMESGEYRLCTAAGVTGRDPNGCVSGHLAPGTTLELGLAVEAR